MYNLIAPIDRKHNTGSTEGDNIRKLLQEIRGKDPGCFFYVKTPESKSTQCIVIVHETKSPWDSTSTIV